MRLLVELTMIDISSLSFVCLPCATPSSEQRVCIYHYVYNAKDGYRSCNKTNKFYAIYYAIVFLQQRNRKNVNKRCGRTCDSLLFLVFIEHERG